MLYYSMVIAAVVLFGLQFLCNQKYQSESGNTLASSMIFLIGSSLVGGIILLIINRFRLSCTPFTLFMALVCTLNGMGSTICNLKALSRINLSLFSLFNMLGGMALPFCAGVLFFSVPLTPGKSICLLTVAAAMLITLRRGDKKDGGGWYYAGIFVFNGMSGVLSKIYTSAPYPVADEASYSIIACIVTVAMCLAILAFIKDRGHRPNLASVLCMSGFGICNKVANLLLLLALAKLPASVQYPMVTGGVIIVSTIFAFFSTQKPRRKEIIAMLVSFVGIMFLFID